MDINRPKSVNFLIPALLLIISLLITHYSVSRIFCFQPTTSDENSYVFQAKLFLKGRFFSDPPILRDFFQEEQIFSGDKWFSRYSPGHSFALIPGVMLNFHNLMPILYNSFMIVITYLLLLKLSKNIILSVIGAVVAISSPFFIAVSGTLLSHTSSSFCIILYIYIFYKSIENDFKNNLLSFIMGFLWSFGFVIRQYTTLLVTAPFVIYHIYLCLKYKKYKSFIFFVTGSLPMISFFFLYNYICTGNPLTQTYTYYDPTQSLGFGMKYYGISRFTPQIAFRQFINNIVDLNKWLFGVPFSLIALIVSIVFSKNDIWKVLFIASILLLITGYFFFYFQGTPWLGPNYYFEIFPILIILFFKNINYIYVKRKFIVYTALLLLFIPSYIFYYPSFFRTMVKNIQRFTKELVTFKDIINENKIHNAVIIIDNDTSYNSWYCMLINNSPFFDDDVLFVHNKGQKNPLLSLWFPERKFYELHFSGKEDTSSITDITESNFKKHFNYIFQFDHNFSKNTGKKIRLRDSDKIIAYGRKGIDTPNYLIFGPYWWFPIGEYKCIFYLRVNKAEDNKPIAKIDICTDSGTKIFAEKILFKSDFKKYNAYCGFPLDFTLSNPAEIETRVYFYGTANLFAQEVQIIAKDSGY